MQELYGIAPNKTRKFSEVAGGVKASDFEESFFVVLDKLCVIAQSFIVQFQNKNQNVHLCCLYICIGGGLVLEMVVCLVWEGAVTEGVAFFFGFL